MAEHTLSAAVTWVPVRSSHGEERQVPNSFYTREVVTGTPWGH